jgi:diaminopimelate decarboxylase
LFAATRPTLELGRYLTAEAGYFVTRVVSIKQSRGARIAICDGGMNNHLPASGHFGMVIRRNYKMHKVGGGESSEPVDVAGPLCTSIDRLATKISLPHLEEGDLIAVHNSGAYGLTASPFHFIGHRPPAEIMVCDGLLQDVTRFFEDISVQARTSHPARLSLNELA